MDDREQTETWPRVGGHLALDFVNTVGGTPETAHHDAIATYARLLLWSEGSEILTPEHSAQLAEEASRSPKAADEVVRRVHRLRDSLYVLFDGLRSGTGNAAGDWDVVRPEFVEAMEHAVPSVTGSKVGWSWTPDAGLAMPSYPIVVGACELMSSDDMALLRRCGRCRFLFLDRSRNHARRWCNMRTCGFADKVERQAERRRSSRGSSG